MTTMNVSLPNDMKAFIDDQVARGGYASASEYVRELVREAQRRQARLELEAMLAEGLQGEPTIMTRKEWKSIAQEALKGLAGEKIRE